MPPFLPRNRITTPSPEPEPQPSKSTDKRNGSATNSNKRKSTLASALDSNLRPRSAAQTKQFISKLAGSDDDDDDSSSLSSLSEPEFEDVPLPPSKRARLTISKKEESLDDDDVEFEDVEMKDVASAPGLSAAPQAPQFNFDKEGEDNDEGEHLDLTLTKETRVDMANPFGNKKRAPTKIERGIRISTHQMHVQFLLWHNALRNAWICDEQVHSILLKQVGENSLAKGAIATWRRACGLETEEKTYPLSSAKSKPTGKGSGKAKAPTKSDDHRRSKDWGSSAQHAARREVDMSHGDPLFRLMKDLSFYWKKRWLVTEPGLRKLGYMPLYRMDEELKSFQNDKHDPERHGEKVGNVEEFRQRAKDLRGSRDLGAQLFTALLRAIGLDARMVVSLQPVGFGWSAGEEAAERKEKKHVELDKGKGDAEISSGEDDGDEEEDNEHDGLASTTKNQPSRSTKLSKPVSKTNTKPAKKQSRINSRASGAKDMPINLSDDDDMEDAQSLADDSVVDITPAASRTAQNKSYEKDLSPNYWTEVLSPVTNTYLPVSTLNTLTWAATNVESLSLFEPKGKKAEKAKQIMAYIIGYSADGTAKDVTVRYLKKHMFPGKTKGMRIMMEKVPVYGRNGKVKRYEQYDWFKTVMSGYVRRDKQRTNADDHEEITDLKVMKPERKDIKEGEETLAYYKASKEFVLERHLKREEALLRNAKHVKTFTVKGKKGAEDEEDKVYLRKDVVNCKTPETWHKEGRQPKVSEEARKRVPYRVATLNRKRELAELERETGQVPLQGLYSIDQTEPIIPPPIENGVIPKNAYGNVDLFTPEMCPAGAIHIPHKGMKKVCNLMGIDFAEAVTGFEFGGRMAIPVITGVVVAEHHEEAALERWNELEVERIRKEDLKKQALVLGIWRKLLMGMRIRQRVADEYGEDIDGTKDESNPWTNKKREEQIEVESRKRAAHDEEEYHGGGFFPDGHTEEAPARSFFPTAHHSDDEGDGGFVVERHDEEDVETKGKEAYATPNSVDSAKAKSGTKLQFEFQRLEPVHDVDDESDTSMSDKSKVKQARDKSASMKKTRVADWSAPKAKAPTSLPKRRPVKKADKVRERSYRDTKSSSSSDMNDTSVEDEDEDDEKYVQPTSKSGGREATRSKSKPVTKKAPTAGTRSAPRRQAAKKSETALKSRYFEETDRDDE